MRVIFRPLQIFILFLVYAIFVGVFAIFGATGDWLHNRKVARGEAEYRLPFYLRWKGWVTGPARGRDPSGMKFGMHHDKSHNRVIPIWRPA
jgi:hypothetical protein